MLLSLARKKLAELSARLDRHNPARRAYGSDLFLHDLIHPSTYYPVIIHYPDSELTQSFLEPNGVAHLRDTDYIIYNTHHEKDL